jgi:acetyltransferase
MEQAIEDIGFPLVMKVVGPVHKTDVGGVVLNIEHTDNAIHTFDRLMKIPEASGVLLQPMLSGTELFAGIKKEGDFGHLILFGLGGIYIEVFKDVRTMLAPLNRQEIEEEIRQLQSFKMLEGTRGTKGVNIEQFADIINALSDLATAAPEIAEMDLNPLLGSTDQVIAVDARIRIEK